jgi:hypothetical protein
MQHMGHKVKPLEQRSVFLKSPGEPKVEEYDQSDKVIYVLESVNVHENIHTRSSYSYYSQRNIKIYGTFNVSYTLSQIWQRFG